MYMFNDRYIAGLVYDYVLVMSKNKRFNPQTIANTKTLLNYGKKRFIDELLNNPSKQFYEKYNSYKVKDFVYKNDSFTPREMYLLNPLYYCYYTFLVFKLVNIYLKENAFLDFSNDRMEIFYSGMLDFNFVLEEINKNSMFNESYNLFQQAKKENFGNPALKIDLQNFFNTIQIDNLIKKLKEVLGDNKVIEELECFFNYCGFNSLPQLHYSIASSILSQFYLKDFDLKIRKVLLRDNLYLIRFVDDMYIIFLSKVSCKDKNKLLDEISFLLWEDSLVLNNNKTKMLSSEEFKEGHEIIDLQYEDAVSFSTVKQVDVKSDEVINNGYLVELIKELCEVEKRYGIDIEKYSELEKSYLSINDEDAGKVLKNIIFSMKWKNMNTNELIGIVSNWKFILFNPSLFTILYILVYRFLEQKKVLKDNGKRIKKLLNYLFRKELFTYRDSVITMNYLFQSNLSHSELIQKVKGINADYVVFIDTFLIEKEHSII